MRSRVRGLGTRALTVSSAYFASIGFGFLLIEVWLLHRFAMYLGHQTFSMGLVLGCLLLSTGAGSELGHSVRVGSERRIAMTAAILTALLLAVRALLPSLLEATWHLSLGARVVVAALTIFPLGMLMGRFFPDGLEWLGARRSSAVPWGIAINFFASVVATVAVIPLALFGGYEQILLIGVGLYVAAGTVSLAMTPDPPLASE